MVEFCCVPNVVAVVVPIPVLAGCSGTKVLLLVVLGLSYLVGILFSKTCSAFFFYIVFYQSHTVALLVRVNFKVAEFFDSFTF